MDGRVLDDASPQFKPPMPHLRALAGRGANFRRAYCGSPQCVPSRTSTLSGRHNSRIKVWDNFVGIAGVAGGAAQLDSHCTKAPPHGYGALPGI
eukprot:gene10224-4372_t